ncbi:DEAD/DEAH box helicase [Sporolactobacillus sp. CPB3-1]|uniref:DEAD/DEAH box helicase n=1 Tax=Sporolactobacillus mangiferae TaxID=2940498 RepID=A0ABT0M7E3_9BACL|nr:DEAD/DEAH box helicase [Sporolactobacillus mangiferae]MCL1630776.1 DEAD/DEAH box helicase [Sporolactobacillus mangiferae]
MVQLTEKIIKNYFSPIIYQRGYSYYSEGHVESLHFDPDTDSWQAEVEGTDYYLVDIHFEGRSLVYHCDCPAAEQFSSPCKHVAAVLLEIKEYQEDGWGISSYNATEHSNEGLMNQLIDTFARVQQKNHDRQHGDRKLVLQTEWTIGLHSSWLTLQMRTGIKRLYVVKKIRDFIQAVINQYPHTFTQKFSFIPSEHRFTPEDQAVIEMLGQQMGYRNYRMMQNAYIGSYSGSDERQFIIPPMLFPKLLNQLQFCSLNFDNGFLGGSRMTLHKNEIPFEFRLEEHSQGGYEVDLSDLKEADYLDQYGYLLKDGAFYSLSSDQQGLIGKLFSIVNRSGVTTLPIGKDQIEPFLSNVAPGLKKISKLTITDTVSERIAWHPLHAKLMVDREEDQLIVQLEYHYGQAVVRPFEQNKETGVEDQIFIRDAEKEQTIMDMLEASTLKISGKRLYAEGEEAIYEFLYEALPELENVAEILLTGSVRTLLMPEQKTPFAKIDMDSSENWLDVRFQLDGINENEIQNILQSLVEKKRYYRLPSGTFVPLEDETFLPVKQMLDELNVSKKELQDNQLNVPIYRGGQIDSILGEKHASVGFGKGFRRFLNRLRNPDLIEFELPDSLHADLRDYQYYGYQWLKTLGNYGLGGILADEMGLGKTVQGIAFLLSEKETKPEVKPALIVTPASLIYNWKNELAKFAPDLEAVVASGTVRERQALFQQGQSPDVWITSYQTLRQDIDAYENETFSTLILDEAQTIKNFNTKTAKSVRKINARNRFAMSGTPIENSIDELWSIFQTLLPGFFPGLSEFKKMEQEKIAKMIRPFLLRRVKKDVLSELPDKIETIQSSELTKDQKELYLAYLEKIQKETKDSLEKEGFQKSRIKILAGLTRLRQICCHPALFLEDYHGESGKLEQLLEMITDYLENGRHILIFSQFTSMLAIIRTALEEKGLSFFYLDGQTPAKQRVDMVDRFNQGEHPIFLLSLKAGNTGLNLTGADTVILYDLWWNPAVEDQAVGRAHRIGQRHVVQVVRMLTQGTIEEKIHELQQKKKDLIESVVESGDQSLSRMTEQEIKEILSI